MSHESVWNSRPRSYGKGARSWYGALHLVADEASVEGDLEEEGK